jgi:hypothetical protein
MQTLWDEVYFDGQATKTLLKKVVHCGNEAKNIRLNIPVLKINLLP